MHVSQNRGLSLSQQNAYLGYAYEQRNYPLIC